MSSSWSNSAANSSKPESGSPSFPHIQLGLISAYEIDLLCSYSSSCAPSSDSLASNYYLDMLLFLSGELPTKLSSPPASSYAPFFFFFLFFLFFALEFYWVVPVPSASAGFCSPCSSACWGSSAAWLSAFASDVLISPPSAASASFFYPTAIFSSAPFFFSSLPSP